MSIATGVARLLILSFKYQVVSIHVSDEGTRASRLGVNSFVTVTFTPDRTIAYSFEHNQNFWTSFSGDPVTEHGYVINFDRLRRNASVFFYVSVTHQFNDNLYSPEKVDIQKIKQKQDNYY